MDIKQLHSLGAFVPKTLFKREIHFKYHPQTDPATWANPDEPEFEEELVEGSMTAHIRKRNSADFLEIATSPSKDASFVAILRCVCDDSGAPVFESIEQVKELKEWLMFPLLEAVNEVNRYDAKKSTPRAISGSSSRSPSAGGASRSGKKRSPRKSGRSG